MAMTLEDFKAARKVLEGVINPTPLVHSPAFSAACGNHVYIKPENLQVTGAYKIRGAYYKVSTMDEEEYKAFDKAWADKLLELYKNKLPEIGNMTPRSVVVQIQRNESGMYEVEAESFRALDDLIIDYTDSAGVMS